MFFQLFLGDLCVKLFKFFKKPLNDLFFQCFNGIKDYFNYNKLNILS